MTDRAVKIISQDDATATVGGYGVVFGGVDLEGETFTPETKYWLDLVPRKPVLYDHSHNKAVGDTPLGYAVKVAPDDIGLWVEAELDKSNDYTDAVLQLIEAGALGYSSGSVAHMTRREGTVIKSWPIVEFSLTATPAEPRTVGVERLKALIKSDDALKQLLAEAAEDAAQPGDETRAADDTNTTSMGEGDNMSDETKVAQAAPALTIDAIKSAFGEQVTPLIERVERLEKALNEPVKSVPVGKAPAHLKLGLGDDPVKAYAHWVKTGDVGAIKASNDTDMNVGTDADGGYAVPTGHFNDIIARRDEMSLPSLVGVREIPGRGTTVNVPVDNEADGEFVSTNEAAAFDRDAPAVSQVAFTLVKYTKKVQLSYELLQDEDSRLMAFLSDFVGRGLAKTDNNLLLTEVGANGTSLKTFGSATVIAVDELEDIIYNNAMGPYLDTSGSVNWVMQPAVYGEIATLDDQNIRRYADNAMGMSNTPGVPNLLGFPVRWSLKSGATAASTRSVYFGNWNFVGRYQAPSLTVLRDPYSSANTGQVNLFYYYRVDYGVLQAEAIGYGEHPSS